MKVVETYTKQLRHASKFGVPSNWKDAQMCFDKFHLPSLTNFNLLKLNNPSKDPRAITKKSYMALYLRCTLRDVADLLYLMYESSLKVDDTIPKVQDTIPFVRLSSLHRVDTSSYSVRSDASVDPKHRGVFGFGYVVSDSKGFPILYKEGKANGNFKNISHRECVIRAELFSMTTALKNAISVILKNANKLNKAKYVKILLDCSSVVEILEGKICPNSDDMMDAMCRIGRYVKHFDEYMADHLYRELNMDCDYLTRCGYKSTVVTKQEFDVMNKNLPRFRHCVDLNKLPLVPKPSPGQT